MSIYDKASLVLIPSGTKTSKVYSQKPVSGDGDFTFSRSTAATRVNADGNIEKETQNLVLQSNSFSTSPWSLQASASLTSGQAGYDGTNDAWLLSKAADYSRLEQTISQSGVWTFSCYAKAGTLDWVSFENSGIAGDTTFFNLNSGTLGTLGSGCIDSSIEDVGSGWYRCSVTISGTSAIMRIQPSVSNGVANGSNGNIYIQDAQLEQGLVARDYIETTTTAVEGGITDNVPRLDYQGSCPALLLEPQRTNSVHYSEYFDSYYDADPQFDNITITHNATTSPEGLQNAAKLAGNNTSKDPSTAYIGRASIVSSQPYVSSVFAKAGEYDYAIVTIGSYSSGFWASFNLDTGVVDTQPTAANTTASIQDYGDGWYRCIIHTTNTAGAEGIYFTPSVDGTISTDYTSTTNGVYFWGAQVEAGSYATSYIPTYGSAVTRGLDSCYLNGVSDIIGQSQGTLYFDIDYQDNGSDYVAIFLYDGTSANRLLVQRRANNDYLQSWATLSSSDLFNYTNQAVVADGNHKIALAYAQNDFQTYLDGASAGSDSSGNTYTNQLTNINLNPNNTLVRINQLMLFKTRLSNEELADLTTL